MFVMCLSVEPHTGAGLRFFVSGAKHCRPPRLAEETLSLPKSSEILKNHLIYGKIGDGITGISL